MALGDCIPFYRPGQDISCRATEALTGCRLVAIVDDRESGPGLSAADDGGLYQVGKPDAGGRVFGVAGYNTPDGAACPVKREGVLPVEAAATLSAFDEVSTDAEGRLIAVTSGEKVGYITTGVTSGDFAEFVLYK